MRRFLVAPLTALLAVTAGVTARAAAWQPTPGQTLTGPLGLTCEYMVDKTDKVDYWLCGGYAGANYGRTWGPNGKATPSFDGVPLDADVTLPADALTRSGQPGRQLPLMAMMHGWGGNKGAFESQTINPANRPEQDNYNNVSFVARGYAVLTYSSRGMGGSCGYQATSATPGCAQGYTHLADRRWEIHDTQFLAGELADAGYVIPSKVGVTGLSYGGGQSWLLALEASQVAQPDGSLAPWTSGPLHHYPMHLAVAVPHYGWSDLIDSLLPNGRAADGVGLSDGNRILPVGIEKESFVDVLFAGAGGPPIYYCPSPCTDPSANLQAWFARISAGEPYSTSDPILKQADTQIRDWKSAYYLDDASLGAVIQADTHKTSTSYEVPLLVVQGWTDDLFPDVEAVSMINKLKHYDSKWPVGLALSDVGHPDAQDKPADWAWINSRANAFIDHYLLNTTGGNTFQTDAQVSNCAHAGGGPVLTAASLQADETGSLSFTSRAARTTTSATDSGAGAQTDPISVYAANGQQGKCIVLGPKSTLPDTEAWSFPLTSSFTLLGAPVLHLAVDVRGTNAEINTRLWDVAPDGSRTLVTRGVYRFSGQPGPAQVAVELFGNGWTFACGDRLELEVTQDDSPYLRPDNEPSQITYTSMRLTLPTHGQNACASAGTARLAAATRPGVPGSNLLPFDSRAGVDLILLVALALVGAGLVARRA